MKITEEILKENGWYKISNHWEPKEWPGLYHLELEYIGSNGWFLAVYRQFNYIGFIILESIEDLVSIETSLELKTNNKPIELGTWEKINSYCYGKFNIEKRILMYLNVNEITEIRIEKGEHRIVRMYVDNNGIIEAIENLFTASREPKTL